MFSLTIFMLIHLTTIHIIVIIIIIFDSICMIMR